MGGPPVVPEVVVPEVVVPDVVVPEVVVPEVVVPEVVVPDVVVPDVVEPLEHQAATLAAAAVQSEHEAQKKVCPSPLRYWQLVALTELQN
jgi:hypothetical protein